MPDADWLLIVVAALVTINAAGVQHEASAPRFPKDD